MMKKTTNFQIGYFPIRTLFMVLLFVIFGFNTNAQSGANDPTFNPTDIGFGCGDGADDDIYSTALQSDGKIIIGGSFSSYNGFERNRIARLNADGTLDTTFQPGTGANSDINTIAIQSDGKIIIGGGFSTYNEVDINRIARLNANGTLDTSFHVGTGTNANIYSTAIQSDGKILISGAFNSYNDILRDYIVRLNVNGTLDTSFHTGTSADNLVMTTAVQNDGKILIGGNFYSYNGYLRSCIARLNIDGTIDTTFNASFSSDKYVHTTLIQNDGKIVIGGSILTSNGYLCRLKADGSIDSTFNFMYNIDAAVRTTTMQSDGKIIVGGSFTSYDGMVRNHIVRLNVDGTIDLTFDSSTGSDNNIYTTTLLNDGKIIIGGAFNLYNEIARNNIARLNTNATLDSTFNLSSGANKIVFTTAIQGDGKIIIGGIFTSYNGVEINGIARLKIDGSLDQTFNTGTGVDGYVWATKIQSDGKIIIGGDFNSYNGISKKNIVRLNTNGTLDTTFISGSGANSAIQTIAMQSDGKIIIGGGFSSYNGVTRNAIARLHVDGSLDTTFNPGVGPNGSLMTTSIQNDGKIVIGGDFKLYNGISRNRIARINTDGTLDTTFVPITGSIVDCFVNTTALQSDGKIILGGNFMFNSNPTNYCIARFNVDGTLDSTFTISIEPNGFVFTTAIQNDGKIIIGGYFTLSNESIYKTIARLNIDGTIDATFVTGMSANNGVSSASLQSDGKIVIGGSFTAYDGHGRNRIARILNCINSVSSITITACNSYSAPDGQVYTSSGVKTAVILNSTGCDSTITINLTINPLDVSTSVNGTVITANANGATYQWLNCANNYSPISGAISQSYTATANGNYAVIVTQGSCSDTSACQQITTVGMSPEQSTAEISMYPNPVSTELTIESAGIKGEVTFEMINSIGQVVHKGSFVGKTTVQTSDLAPGVYLIKLGDDKTFEFKKIVKE